MRILNYLERDNKQNGFLYIYINCYLTVSELPITDLNSSFN